MTIKSCTYVPPKGSDKKMRSVVKTPKHQGARDSYDRQEVEVIKGTITESDSNEELALLFPPKAVKKQGTSTKGRDMVLWVQR